MYYTSINSTYTTDDVLTKVLTWLRLGGSKPEINSSSLWSIDEIHLLSLPSQRGHYKEGGASRSDRLPSKPCWNFVEYILPAKPVLKATFLVIRLIRRITGLLVAKRSIGSSDFLKSSSKYLTPCTDGMSVTGCQVSNLHVHDVRTLQKMN